MSSDSSQLLLEVISGKAVGTMITVEDELVIGRHADGPGRLSDDEEISRQHARVSREATGDYAIEDLGSSNGTFINGLRIQSPRLLAPGDSIETGATTLVVREIARAETAETAAPAGGRADATAPAARSAPTSAHSTVTPQPVPPAPPADASPAPEQAAGPTPPREQAAPTPPPQQTAGPAPPLGLRLDVDFDAREARITLGSGGDTVRMVLEDGAWRAVSTGLDADD